MSAYFIKCGKQYTQLLFISGRKFGKFVSECIDFCRYGGEDKGF